MAKDNSDAALTLGFIAFCLGLLGTIWSGVVLMAGPSTEDIDKLNERIDALECELAEDEEACLWEILED